MTRRVGVGVSPGVAYGRAVVFIHRSRILQYRIPVADRAAEMDRLAEAVALARQQLDHLRSSMAGGRGRDLVALFDAQILMLDDPLLVPRARTIVSDQLTNAEWALQVAFSEFSRLFDEIEDPYLRERKGDVADLVGRLQMNLRRGRAHVQDLLAGLDESSVLVADELPASVAAQIDWSRVRGFATDVGSRTYHTAILARSLDVPAVVGLQDATRVVAAGQFVLLNGVSGELILDPDEATVASALRTDAERCAEVAAVHPPTTQTRTADGIRIVLDANVEFPGEVAQAKAAGAEGIGLYRSEFLLTASGGWPGEEEQYAAYRELLDGMAPDPVTIRTFDVDEDQLARVALAQEGAAEPQIWDVSLDRGSRQGSRGLRLSLARPDLFRTQIRALLRAACHGHLRIVFPFVSSVDQIRAARLVVEDVSLALRAAGMPVPSVALGAMIEIPAAAYTADLIAKEADFLTIGTNDLIQYCLAVDRTDARVSQLYEPFHPAILRVIRLVRRAAVRQGRRVSLCGEMASDPVALALLVGLGLTEFSMASGAIRVARQVLQGRRRADLRALAQRVLRLGTAAAIEQELEDALCRPA